MSARDVRDLLDSSRLAVRAALDSSSDSTGEHACRCGACNRGREYIRSLDRFLEANPSFGLPTPPPQASEALERLRAEQRDLEPGVCAAIYADLPSLYTSAPPAPPQAHWEIKGKDVTLVAAEPPGCIHDHVTQQPGGWFDCDDCGARTVTPNNGASVTAPFPPAVPAGEGPTADQWQRAMALVSEAADHRRVRHATTCRCAWCEDLDAFLGETKGESDGNA